MRAHGSSLLWDALRALGAGTLCALSLHAWACALRDRRGLPRVRICRLCDRREVWDGRRWREGGLLP